MNKFIFFLSTLLLTTIISCNTDTENKQNTNTGTGNKFADQTMQIIAQAQYNRDTETLLSYFNDKNADYREAAAMAFASVQDTTAIIGLTKLLSDKELKVKIAAAFAIGQSNSTAGAKILYARFLKENNDLVKKAFLEAIGKCGDEQIMQKVIDLPANAEHEDILAGKALALARFSIRGIANEQSLKEIFRILQNPQISETVKYDASIALNRNKKPVNDEQLQIIKSVYTQSKIIDTQLNLVMGAGKNLSDSSLFFLYSVFENAGDYRLRINALRALSSFDYEKVRDIYFSALNDENINVAIYASEYFIGGGSANHVNLYFEKAKELANWRVKANMLLAANKFADEEQKSKISKLIIDNYQKEKNNYAKAWMLKALSGNPNQWEFIKNEIFNTSVPVIRSMGMDALSEIYSQLDKKDDKMQQEFAEIFKQAVLSKDVALISVAAGILRNPDFDFKNLITDYEFLNTAANNCQLPKELEAYLELQKTLVYFKDSGTVEMPNIKYKKPDWEIIKNISPTQKIVVCTSKGDFTIQLNVEDNPVTVFTFIELIKSDFYKGLHIHRVVPNFVIQDGCPRGDGWGSPDFSIRSEFYNSYYETGSLGMASAGKDTESSQWFVTHSPTPHLDGRYTMFGKVIEGMDVVHKIEVGDEIYNIELL